MHEKRSVVRGLVPRTQQRDNDSSKRQSDRVSLAREPKGSFSRQRRYSQAWLGIWKGGSDHIEIGVCS